MGRASSSVEMCLLTMSHGNLKTMLSKSYIANFRCGGSLAECHLWPIRRTTRRAAVVTEYVSPIVGKYVNLSIYTKFLAWGDSGGNLLPGVKLNAYMAH